MEWGFLEDLFRLAKWLLVLAIAAAFAIGIAVGGCAL